MYHAMNKIRRSRRWVWPRDGWLAFRFDKTLFFQVCDSISVDFISEGCVEMADDISDYFEELVEKKSPQKICGQLGYC